MLVVDEAKKVELRRVATGVEQGRDVVVTAGLKEGELVVVEGSQKARVLGTLLRRTSCRETETGAADPGGRRRAVGRGA